MIFRFIARNYLTDGCLITGSDGKVIRGSFEYTITGSVGCSIVGSVVGAVNLFAGQL